MKQTAIISAFHCCGKTYATKKCSDKYDILDLNCNDYQWVDKKGVTESIRVANDNFPNNYIEKIKENIGKYDIIFVDSYLKIRKCMYNNGIKFCTVIPDPKLKTEWVGRMYLRGDKSYQIARVMNMWDSCTQEVYKEPHGFGILWLHSNDYISNHIDFLRHW